MSEIISHLAEPLIEEHCETAEDTQRIISLTIAAWNLSLLPPETRERPFVSLANKLYGKSFWGIQQRAPQEKVDEFRELCDLVVSRKQQFYPDVNHLILDVHFDLADEEDIYFEVMYALAPNA